MVLFCWSDARNPNKLCATVIKKLMLFGGNPSTFIRTHTWRQKCVTANVAAAGVTEAER